MSEFDERYARQLRLPEVGPSGMRRLLQASVSIGDWPGAEIQRMYLERAGVRQLHPSDEPPPKFPHHTHFRHVACSELASGAWLALHQIRQTLQIPEAT